KYSTTDGAKQGGGDGISGNAGKRNSVVVVGFKSGPFPHPPRQSQPFHRLGPQPVDLADHIGGGRCGWDPIALHRLHPGFRRRGDGGPSSAPLSATPAARHKQRRRPPASAPPPPPPRSRGYTA